MTKEEDKEKDKEKAESASSQFSNVVDATSEFLKKTFPYGYALIQKIKNR